LQTTVARWAHQLTPKARFCATWPVSCELSDLAYHCPCDA
jgi:hypothetical protein